MNIVVAAVVVVDSIQVGIAVAAQRQVDSTGLVGNTAGLVAPHQVEDTDQLSGCLSQSGYWSTWRTESRCHPAPGSSPLPRLKIIK